MPYNFTVDDFNKFSQDIIQAGGDQASLTSLLADMGGTFTEAVAKDIATGEKLSTVTAENDRLKSANMELFLRVGTKVAEDAGVITKQQEQEKPEQGVSDYMRSYFDKLQKGK